VGKRKVGKVTLSTGKKKTDRGDQSKNALGGGCGLWLRCIKRLSAFLPYTRNKKEKRAGSGTERKKKKRGYENAGHQGATPHDGPGEEKKIITKIMSWRGGGMGGKGEKGVWK